MKMIRLLTILLVALFMVAGTTIKRGPGGGGKNVITLADPGTDEAIYFYDSATGKLVESPCTIEEASAGLGTLKCPDQTTIGGNIISLHGHDDNVSPDTTCANKGEAGKLAILDVDESASTEDFAVCYGTTRVGALAPHSNTGQDTTAEGIYHLGWYVDEFGAAAAFDQAATDCGVGLSSGSPGCTFVLPEKGANDLAPTDTVVLGGVGTGNTGKYGINIRGTATGGRISPSDESLCGSVIDGSNVPAGRPVIRLIGVRGGDIRDFCVNGGDTAGRLIEFLGSNGTESGATNISAPTSRITIANLQLTNAEAGLFIGGMGSAACTTTSCTVASAASLTYAVDTPSAGQVTISGTDFTSPVDISAGDWIYVNGATNEGYVEVVTDGTATDVVVYDPNDFLSALTETADVHTSHVHDQADTFKSSNIGCGDVEDCIIQNSTQAVWNEYEHVNAKYTHCGVWIEGGSANITESHFTPDAGSGAVAGVCLGNFATEWVVARSNFETREGTALFGGGAAGAAAGSGGGQERVRTFKENRIIDFGLQAQPTTVFEFDGRGVINFVGNQFDVGSGTTTMRVVFDAGSDILQVNHSGNYLRRGATGNVLLDLQGNAELASEDGIFAGMGTEKTPAYWRNKQSLDVSEHLMRRTLWFDAYEGSDSNEGTKHAPLQTFSKAKAECGVYTRCTFEKGQVWSDNTFPLTSVSGSFIKGETVTWGSNSHESVVFDYHPETQTAVFDDTHDPFVITVDATSGHFGISYIGHAAQVCSGGTNDGVSCEANGDGDCTGGGTCQNAVDFDAAASVVEIALESMDNIGAATCTGAAGGPYTCSLETPESPYRPLTVSDVDLAGGGDSVSIADTYMSASTAITGATSGATATTGTAIENLGPTADTSIDVVADAVFDDRVVTLLTSNAPASDPSQWPVIHGNGQDVGAGGTVFSASGGSASGWVGVEKFGVVDVEGDAFSNSNEGKILGFHTYCDEARNDGASDDNNNCYTSHATGGFIHVNWSARGYSNSAGSNGTPLAMTGTSSSGASVLSVNGESVNDMSHTGHANQAATITGGAWTLINAVLRCVNDNANCNGFRASAATSTPVNARLAKVSVSTNSAASSLDAIRLDPVASGAEASFFGRQITSIAPGGTCIQLGSTNAAAVSNTVDIQGLLCDEYALSVFEHFEDAADANRVTLTLQGVIDEDDVASPIRVLNVTHNTLDSAQSALSSAGVTSWSFFADDDTASLDSGTKTVDGNQFGSLAGFRCADSSKECWEAYETPYFVELPANLKGRIPVELTGGKQLYGFSLGGQRAHYGAH